ncbi:MAG: PIG-L family deacetylase [Chloroflexota bacterium]|nr:PIG-L family deacetylase [Chloroflexota bacterium]
MRLAAAAIGYAGVELLDYPDGGLAALPAGELEAVVFAAIERHRPQVVLTFGPAGITRHPDHLAVHRARTAAFDRALAAGLGVRELYYVPCRPSAPPRWASRPNQTVNPTP